VVLTSLPARLDTHSLTQVVLTSLPAGRTSIKFNTHPALKRWAIFIQSASQTRKNYFAAKLTQALTLVSRRNIVARRSRKTVALAYKTREQKSEVRKSTRPWVISGLGLPQKRQVS
jgi:hypothetical protein